MRIKCGDVKSYSAAIYDYVRVKEYVHIES